MLRTTNQGRCMAKVGRPSTYDPIYCNTVIEAGKLGKSYTQMAVACETFRATLDRWQEEHPEFRTAVAHALTLAQDWWETAGQNGMLMREFNASVWKHMVASRFRDDYADRKLTEVTGRDGGALQIEAVTIDVKDLDPDARDAIKAALLAAAEGQ